MSTSVLNYILSTICWVTCRFIAHTDFLKRSYSSDRSSIMITILRLYNSQKIKIQRVFNKVYFHSILIFPFITIIINLQQVFPLVISFFGEKAYRKYQGDQLPLESLFLCLYVKLPLSDNWGTEVSFQKLKWHLGG